jgi:neutrophil factor 2
MVSGLADLKDASQQKQVEEHGVIDDAIRDGGREYNVFSVPVSAVFRHGSDHPL